MTARILLALIAVVMIVGAASGYSEYCVPPTDLTTTVDHQGNWFNITITSELCYTCIETGGGYGDVECYKCDDRATAAFISNVTCGIVPFAVVFSDTSVGPNITAFNWTFDGFNTSVEEDPVFVYNVSGMYSVNHSVSNTAGDTWVNKSNYIAARVPGDTCAGAGGQVYYYEDDFPGTPINPAVPVAGLAVAAYAFRRWRKRVK